MKLLACTVSAALCLSMSAAAYAEADVDGIQTTIGEAISTEAAESPYDSALTDDIYASATGTLNISGTQNYTYASQVITLLNEQRVNNGLSPLTADSTLTAAAMQRAAETVIYFSHTRPNGSRCFTAFDGGWRGENIAAGQADPDEVITGWMNSTGHRENILKANYTSVGVGCFNYKGINFWVQCFSDITADGSVRTGTASATAAVSASTDYINMSGKLAENTFSSAGETTIFTVSNNNVGWTYITATVDSSSFNYSSSSSAAKVDSAGNVTVAGGGTALINAMPAVSKLTSSLQGDEKTGAQIVLKALEEPVRQIAKNAGLEGSVIIDKIIRSRKVGYGFDAYNETYVDMIPAGIVDPTKVTRSALQNAASVAAMVLTTESLVADIKEETPAAPAGAGMGGMGGMY